jgi:uncharacterized protein (DUF427 family)
MAHITVTRASDRVTVAVGGEVIAESRGVLVLTEGRYPPVYYVPKADIEMARLAKTATTSHCPHKGDATYWSVDAGGATVVDAGWSYDAPFDGVAKIKDHIAFYPSKVSVEPAQG